MLVDEKFTDVVGDVLRGEELQTRNGKVLRATNLRADFTTTPLISIRKTAWKLALREMEWFLSGSNHIGNLHESVRHWWTPWINSEGNIPNNYSMYFKQIENIIEGIIYHPNSRRLVMSTWGKEMWDEETPITNCHGTVLQFFVREGRLDMTMYQRSADVMLGLQHNWIQYWALLQYVANRTTYEVGKFTWLGGDCHIYEPHLPLAKKLDLLEFHGDTPDLIYRPTASFFKADDFDIDYDYSPIFTDKLEMIV